MFNFRVQLSVCTSEVHICFGVVVQRLQEVQNQAKSRKTSSREGADLMKYYAQLKKSVEPGGSPDKGVEAAAAATGASSSSMPATESDPQEDEPVDDNTRKPKKDLVRFRAGCYEKSKKLILACETDHSAALKSAEDTLSKYATEKDSMSHFFEILEVRSQLLKSLNKDNAGTWMADLQTYQDKLKFLPVSEEQLRKLPVIGDFDKLLKGLLSADKVENVEAASSDIKNACAVHSQLRSALKSSTKDIENAVKSKVKKAEAAAKKAKKTAEKNEKKAKDEAAAAAKGRGSGGAKLIPTFITTEMNKFMCEIQTFETFELFEKDLQKVSGKDPFFIKQYAPLKDFLENNVNVKCQLVNFTNQFQGTQVCKETGRAQCPVVGDAQKHVSALFEKVFSTIQAKVPDEGPEAKALKPILHSALFGFTGAMEYTGIEDKGFAQVRFVQSGVRKVFVISLEDWVDHCMPSKPDTIQDVLHAWKFAKMEDLVAKKVEDKIVPVIQHPGSLLYVPACWLVWEKAENGAPVVGFRHSLVAKATTDSLQMFSNLLPKGNRLKEVVEAGMKVMPPV